MIEIVETIDFAILDMLQNLKCDLLDVSLGAVTHLGDGGMMWIGTALAFLFFKKLRKCGVMMLFSLALCALITSGVIKPIVGRLRPFEVREIPIFIQIPYGTSFPSGHTSSSFAASTAIFLNKRRISIVPFLLAIAIGFSRMYFYVHFPSDVLCGALLGACCAAVICRIFGNEKSEKREISD